MASSGTSRWATWLLLAGVAAWLVNALLGWIAAPPLGHDEAQYALSAKDIVAGHDPRWIYVSRGMSVVALPGVLAGGSELAMRFLPLVFSCGFVVASWLFARRLFGALTAAWVVALLAASPFHTS